MINFPCHCGHKFSVAEDMAGGMLQCPRCGRLCDVPLLSDLGHLSEDGTYNLDLIPEKDQAEVAAELQRIYQKGRIDDEGHEIDLRPTMDDIYTAGSEEVPTELADDVRPGAPKYDPVTGELILPVDVNKAAVAPGTPSSAIARPALAYAGGEFAVGVTPLKILLELFRPVNLIVMFFVLLGHALLAMTIISVLARALIVVIMLPGIIFALIAHYGNVVDETGPSGRDELPTPLRGLQWHDDLWGPFRDWMLALMVCYGPALVVMFFPPPQQQIAAVMVLALGAIGTVAFPAVLLTTLTSGTILNLRPDRVFMVMGKCGFHYVILVLVWIAAATVYVWGTLASLMSMIALLGFAGSLARLWFHPFLILPLLMGGIYLMHYFAWYLGLMYRAHHDEFPWLYQRHIGRRRQRGQGFAVVPPGPARPPQRPGRGPNSSLRSPMR